MQCLPCSVKPSTSWLDLVRARAPSGEPAKAKKGSCSSMFNNDDIEEIQEHYALHIELKNAETRIRFSRANKAEVASDRVMCPSRHVETRVNASFSKITSSRHHLNLERGAADIDQTIKQSINHITRPILSLQATTRQYISIAISSGLSINSSPSKTPTYITDHRRTDQHSTRNSRCPQRRDLAPKSGTMSVARRKD
jgi:hypothetical protein